MQLVGGTQLQFLPSVLRMPGHEFYAEGNVVGGLVTGQRAYRPERGEAKTCGRRPTVCESYEWTYLLFFLGILTCAGVVRRLLLHPYLMFVCRCRCGCAPVGE